MLNIMKKTIIFLFAAISLVSCRIDEGENDLVDSWRLAEYGDRLMLYVESGANMLVTLLEVDRYESMSHEEQAGSWLKGMLLHIDDNTVVIDRGYDDIVIHTGGKSLKEPGAEWKVDNYSDQYYYYSAFDMDAAVICSAPGKWGVVSDAESPDVQFRMDITAEEGPEGYDGTFTVEGQEVSGTGYVAEFASEGGPCPYTAAYVEEGSSSIFCTFTGDFSVDIFEGQSPKDWIRMSYSEDGQVTVETSRD